MIVYGEVLVAENCIIGGVLLYITAGIFGISLEKPKRKLLLLGGSLLCGLFSLVLFLPVHMPVTLVLEGLFALGVCFLVFGKKALWKKAVTFLLVTYFMGGITMGLLLATGNPGIYGATGIYTGDMKAAMLALFTGITLGTAKQIIRTVSAKKYRQAHVLEAAIVLGERQIVVKAFVDTGNGLRDPVKGRPVAVAADSLWQQMEEGRFLREDRYCLIPYTSVGARGLLEGVRVDYIETKGRRIKECVIAKGDGEFHLENRNREEGCSLLLSKDMTEMGI